MLVQKAQNPTTYQGMRLALLYQINDNWNALIQQTYQNMDAEGMPVQMPVGLGFEQLQPLEETSYTPAWNKDKASITSWTVNGQIGFLKGIYTGSYLTRSVDANMDYSNYTRTAGGFYYSCTGGGGSNMNGEGPATCYSPVMGWHDYFKTTHQSHEVRLSTPEDLRLRGLLGFYWEDFQIKDDMNFNQKTIPSCTPENLAAALLPGGPICLGERDPGRRGDRSDDPRRQHQLRRGSTARLQADCGVPVGRLRSDSESTHAHRRHPLLQVYGAGSRFSVRHRRALREQTERRSRLLCDADHL